jgi:2-oxo-hept-3-ene-1,7-dioate hydratase
VPRVEPWHFFASCNALFDACAGVVMSNPAHNQFRADPFETNLPWCGAPLMQNNAVEETGLAAGVQGHPAIGVAWLANRLAPWGEHLRGGQIVLAGSFTRPVIAKPGDHFVADYGPLGRLAFEFTV